MLNEIQLYEKFTNRTAVEADECQVFEGQAKAALAAGDLDKALELCAQANALGSLDSISLARTIQEKIDQRAIETCATPEELLQMAKQAESNGDITVAMKLATAAGKGGLRGGDIMAKRLFDAFRAEVSRPKVKQWMCECGSLNNSLFCPECGARSPWQCHCGAYNSTKFCSQCGAPRPE